MEIKELFANLMDDVQKADIPGNTLIRIVREDHDDNKVITKYYLPEQEVDQEDVGKVEHVRLIDLVTDLTKRLNDESRHGM